jgi:zinc transport system ATP-binding protein
MSELNAIVSIDDVWYRYNSSSPALESISFTVNEGDVFGIVGPNGSGKTTLFNCILGLSNDYKGIIRVFNSDLRKNRKVLRRIGYVPQHTSFEPNFPATVEEIVSFGLIGERYRKNENSAKSKITSSIEIMELSDIKDRKIGELSGGQQQRVLISKALVNDPALLLLDEPTTGIDQKTQNEFFEIIEKLNQEKRISIILSSHDLDVISKLANKVICINKRMFFHGNTHEFFDNPDLMKMYYEASMQAHMRLHKDLYEK